MTRWCGRRRTRSSPPRGGAGAGSTARHPPAPSHRRAARRRTRRQRRCATPIWERASAPAPDAERRRATGRWRRARPSRREALERALVEVAVAAFAGGGQRLVAHRLNATRHGDFGVAAVARHLHVLAVEEVLGEGR